MQQDSLLPTTLRLAAVPGREPPALALGRTAPDDPPAVRVRGLVKRYGRTTAVDGLDLRLPAAAVLALLGPNGAGKTTLVLHLNGVLTGGTGTVTVAGLPVSQDRSVDSGAKLD